MSMWTLFVERQNRNTEFLKLQHWILLMFHE